MQQRGYTNVNSLLVHPVHLSCIQNAACKVDTDKHTLSFALVSRVGLSEHVKAPIDTHTTDEPLEIMHTSSSSTGYPHSFMK